MIYHLFLNQSIFLIEYGTSQQNKNENYRQKRNYKQKGVTYLVAVLLSNFFLGQYLPEKRRPHSMINLGIYFMFKLHLEMGTENGSTFFQIIENKSNCM